MNASFFITTKRDLLVEQIANQRARRSVANTTKLWWWKARMNAKKARDEAAKNVKPLNHIASYSAAPDAWECKQYAKAAAAEHIALNAPSAMLMCMALHETKQRLARCGS